MSEVSVRRQGIRASALTKRYGALTVFADLDLEVAPGELLAIVGPSGCGKSTLLRIVAGIESVDTGSIHIGDRDVTYAHPGKRNLGMVFQDYALYPHMTVEQNLTFGLRAQRLPKAQIGERVGRVAHSLEIQPLLSKLPSQLSGGQRQRVALGRAMIREPGVYLMDEPLSNLDALLRVQMRAELIAFHKRIAGTVLYVTHDQVEAMTMGTRVAVMNHGRFEQVASPHDVYERPVNLFVATFIGSPRMNVLEGKVHSRDGVVDITCGSMRWQISESSLGVTLPESVHVGIRPECFRPVDGDRAPLTGESEPFDLELQFSEYLGNEVVSHFDAAYANGGSLVTRLTPSEALRLTERGWRLTVASQDIHIFDMEGNALWHGNGAEETPVAASAVPSNGATL